MSASSGSGPLNDEHLWVGLNEHVRSTLGVVGVSKMLGARDDQDAKAKWVSRVRPELEMIARRAPLTEVGPARFALENGITVQLRIHRVTVLRDDVPRISAMIAARPAAVTLAAVGRARWGSDWRRALEALGSARRVVAREDIDPDVTVFPWVAQNPGTPGPWVSAATAEEARESGLAQDIGSERVSLLFDQF